MFLNIFVSLWAVKARNLKNSVLIKLCLMLLLLCKKSINVIDNLNSLCYVAMVWRLQSIFFNIFIAFYVLSWADALFLLILSFVDSLAKISIFFWLLRLIFFFEKNTIIKAVNHCWCLCRSFCLWWELYR